MTVPTKHGRSAIDGAALAKLIQVSGLLDGTLALGVGEIAGRFPEPVQSNLFLEFEFAEGPVPAGFGLGFEAGLLDYYRVVRDPFLSSAQGQSLQTALARDPFAADHREHLNLFGDRDPDWVEFDIADALIAPTPFVFFRLPSRFRNVSDAAEVSALCAILPGQALGGEFSRLLDRIVAVAPACPYRIGVARSRGAGWWRAIMTNLNRRQVEAALTDLDADGLDGVLAPAARLYDRWMDSPGACYALSIDVNDNRVTAVDVECPYLFRVADAKARVKPLGDYALEIAGSGLVSPANAAWISGNAVRDVGSSQVNSTLRIMLHHLKFRLFGVPRLRAKAYLHLCLVAEPRPSEPR